LAVSDQISPAQFDAIDFQVLRHSFIEEEAAIKAQMRSIGRGS
jgi:hypothetical protein